MNTLNYKRISDQEDDSSTLDLCTTIKNQSLTKDSPPNIYEIPSNRVLYTCLSFIPIEFMLNHVINNGYKSILDNFKEWIRSHPEIPRGPPAFNKIDMCVFLWNQPGGEQKRNLLYDCISKFSQVYISLYKQNALERQLATDLNIPLEVWLNNKQTYIDGIIVPDLTGGYIKNIVSDLGRTPSSYASIHNNKIKKMEVKEQLIVNKDILQDLDKRLKEVQKKLYRYIYRVIYWYDSSSGKFYMASCTEDGLIKHHIAQSLDKSDIDILMRGEGFMGIYVDRLFILKEYQGRHYRFYDARSQPKVKVYFQSKEEWLKEKKEMVNISEEQIKKEEKTKETISIYNKFELFMNILKSFGIYLTPKQKELINNRGYSGIDEVRIASLYSEIYQSIPIEVRAIVDEAMNINANSFINVNPLITNLLYEWNNAIERGRREFSKTKVIMGTQLII